MPSGGFPERTLSTKTVHFGPDPAQELPESSQKALASSFCGARGATSPPLALRLHPTNAAAQQAPRHCQHSPELPPTRGFQLFSDKLVPKAGYATSNKATL